MCILAPDEGVATQLHETEGSYRPPREERCGVVRYKGFCKVDMLVSEAGHIGFVAEAITKR